MNACSRRNGSAGNPVKFGEPRPKPPLICGALRGVLAAAFTWKSGHPWRPLSLPFFFSFSPTTCQLSGTAPLLVGLQLICSIHIWYLFQPPARKKTKTTECIPHLLQYEINRLEPIDESLKSSARASVFNRREIRKFLFRFSLRIVRGKFWNLSWNFKFRARKIGDDGEKNKSSEKASSRVCFSFSAKEKYLIRCWWSSARSSRSNDCGRRDFFNGHLNVPLLSSF